MRLARPLVRYHGGKWRLAPWILSHLPRHRIYVEPFGGGASVLLAKSRSYAEIYNDLDGEMVNLFRIARDRGDELARAVALTPFAQEEFRLSHEITDGPLERARRTLIRSHMGFGSNGIHRQTGFRGNAKRRGTTPAIDWRRLPEALEAVVDRLQGVIIEHRDALDVIRDHDGPDSVHYIDPPYPAAVRDPGADYRHEMTDADHETLASALYGLEGAVVLSGYDCPMYQGLYSDWRQVRCTAQADGDAQRVEVLWLSPNLQLPQPDLFINREESGQWTESTEMACAG